MGELPSKYSSRGLSSSEQRRVITTGKPRHNRPVGAIKIEERVNSALRHTHQDEPQTGDFEGDIPMISLDDEEEVQLISEFVTERREMDPQSLNNMIREPAFMTEELTVPTVERVLARDTFMVVDTNFMISHLDIVDRLAKLHKQYHHTIVIPVTVVKELDGLKESQRLSDEHIDGATVGHLARWANDWIYSKLAVSDNAVRGQKLKEKLDRSAVKDDSILDCCLYLMEKEGAFVVLLSNDKNLCMKALTNDVRTVSYRKGMTAELIATMAFKENEALLNKEHGDGMELPDAVDHEEMDVEQMDHEILQEMSMDEAPLDQSTANTSVVQYANVPARIMNEMQKVVLDAIDHCMFEEYGEDVELLGYDKSNVLTMNDAANVLIKYWISVFTEYFHDFSPFNKRGKKQPKFVHEPRGADELREFVEYWSDVLRCLYMKRESHQRDALEQLISHWENLVKS